MSSPIKVALAGATGQLGEHILRHLLAANHPVVILTRADSSTKSKLPSSDLISVAEVDYNSTDSITPHLNGVHTVIAAVGSTSIASQTNLVTAAASASVQRFIPSEFGSDTLLPENAKLPVYAAKTAVKEQLKSLSATNPSFTYTLFYNNAFLDSGLTNGFIADVPNHKANLYDGGERPFSATKLDTIGRAVVTLLQHLEETKNRAVYIQDVATTQKEVIDIVKEKDGQSWSIAPIDLPTLLKDSYAELGKDKPDFGTAMVGFVRQAAFGEGRGCDFSDHLDNELLGVKGLTKEEWKEYVRSFVK
jgi:nucleoside-diphosphate-sugar epimerase